MSATFGIVSPADVFHYAIGALLSDWFLEAHLAFTHFDRRLPQTVLMAFFAETRATFFFLPFNKYKDFWFPLSFL